MAVPSRTLRSARMATRPVSPRLLTAKAPRRRLGVVLIDPLPVVRAGLAMLIENRADMEVLAEAGSAREGLEKLAGVHRSNVVVLVGLGLEGDQDAYWMIRTVRERYPGLAILGCGAKADPMAISRALFMGADGFVDKNVDPIEFLQALGSAAEGEMVLAGPPTEWVGAIAAGIEERGESESRLTDRETQVLRVAAEGLTAREIGARLGVRERTVTTHLGRIYGKLGVGTRVAAIRVASISGLVSIGAPE